VIPPRSAARAAILVAALVLAAPAWAQPGGLRGWLGLGSDADAAWKGDLDGMIERRRIRLLVVPSRTYDFVDEGTPRGLSHDQGRPSRRS
jgi:hypothetical protein